MLLVLLLLLLLLLKLEMIVMLCGGKISTGLVCVVCRVGESGVQIVWRRYELL